MAALSLVLAVVLYINREKIKTSVLSQTNEILAVPVAVGDISVSLKKFPYASILLTDVFCAGANAQSGDTLVFTKELYLEFGLWKVLFSDISIDEISLKSGRISIKMPKDKIPNYQIWKDVEDSEGESVLTLEKVSFDDFRLLVWEESANFQMESYVEKTVFSGSFRDEFSIKNKGKLWIDSLLLDKVSYVRNLWAETSFELNGTADNSRIEKGMLETGNVKLNFGSKIQPQEITFSANNESLDLESTVHLLRTQNISLPEKMKVNGNGNFQLQAIFPDGKSSKMEMIFETDNATISHPDYSKIRDFTCRAIYKYENDKSWFDFQHFSGKGKSGGFSGKLQVANLEKPKVVLDLKSNLNLQEWLIFAQTDTLQNVRGKTELELHFENQFTDLQDIRPKELAKAKASGFLKLEGVAFSFKDSDKKIERLNGNLRFAGNDFEVEDFYFKTGKSDIFLSGDFRNVLNAIYFKDEQIKIDTRVKSQEIRMEDFLVAQQSSGEETYSLEGVKKLDLELMLVVDKFRFEKFYASDISGNLRVKDGALDVSNISLKSDKGSYSGNFQIDTRPNPPMMQVRLKARGIEIHDVFVSFKNFGQEEILAEHIYGKADADVQLSGNLTPSLSVDPASVKMVADLSIQNGQLKDYEPMSALSRFAKIEELKDVRFDQMKNQITIENSVIQIPEMTVKSNVLSLDIKGTHDFENQVDYGMTLKLSDVLFAKRKNKKRGGEFDDHLTTVDQGRDPNIYIKMTGYAGDPKISLDQRGYGKSVADGVKKQGEDLKDIFKKKNQKKEDKKSSGIEFDLWGDDDGGE